MPYPKETLPSEFEQQKQKKAFSIIEEQDKTFTREALSRRSFLSRVALALGGISAFVAGSGLGGPQEAGAQEVSSRVVTETEPRLRNLRRVRERATNMILRRRAARQRSNGSEKDFPNFIASYSKGLEHNELGEVNPKLYRQFLRAVASGRPGRFENLPAMAKGFKNPLAAVSFDLVGLDASQVRMPPAPRLDEARSSSEMAELYWMALCRDVNFTWYNNDPLIQQACQSLSSFSEFNAPKVNQAVTAGTIFRGTGAQNLSGPYISQFFYRDAISGSTLIPARQFVHEAGLDYLTDYNFWLQRQNGLGPLGQQTLPQPRYITNGRDLASFVYSDLMPQPFLTVATILLAMEVPADRGNRYNSYLNMEPFFTFGQPHLFCLLGEVAARAAKAVWYQKWNVHRRLRPEEFGGRIHNHLLGKAQYPIHQEILNSDLMPRIFDHNRQMNSAEWGSSDGSFLLPQAYQEGCPHHPSYGAGHAAVAGACATVLKAWFNEDFVISNPVVPNDDGTELVSYSGPVASSLTVRGELDKFASNIAMGRNFAGVHYRTDAEESLLLGEQIAISVMKAQNICYPEKNSFHFTRFNGKSALIKGSWSF